MTPASFDAPRMKAVECREEVERAGGAELDDVGADLLVTDLGAHLVDIVHGEGNSELQQ